MKRALILAALMICTTLLAKPPQPAPLDVPAMLRTVPDSAYPARGQKWTQIKADVANDALKQVIGKKASITLTVKGAGRRQEPADSDFVVSRGGPYYLKSADVLAPSGTFHVSIWVYFAADEKAKLAKINTGDTVVVTGKIVKAEFVENPDRGWLFALDIGSADLQRAP